MLRVRTFFGLLGLWFKPETLNMDYGTPVTLTYKEYGSVVGTSAMETINSLNYYVLNGGSHYATDEATLSFETTKPNQLVLIEIRSSASASDYMCAGLLDDDSITEALIKISGTLSQTYTYTIPSAGDHYIKFFFRNSGSNSGGNNKGYFRLIPFDNTKTVINNAIELVEVKSYTDWKLYSKSDWITSVSPSQAERGKLNLTIEASPNYGNPRSGNITLQELKKGDLFTLPINLASTENRLVLSRDYVAVNDDAGSITVNVDLFGSTSWSVPQGSWYTISPTSGGDGAQVTISWGSNTGGERSANIIFTGNNGGQDTLVLSLETYICHCDCVGFCSCDIVLDCPAEYTNACSCDSELRCSCDSVCGCDNNKNSCSCDTDYCSCDSDYCNCNTLTACSCDTLSCSCNTQTGCGSDKCSCDTESCDCDWNRCLCDGAYCSCNRVCSGNYNGCASNSDLCSCDGFRNNTVTCSKHLVTSCTNNYCRCDSDICNCNTQACTCNGDRCSCDTDNSSVCSCLGVYCANESYSCQCDNLRESVESIYDDPPNACSATGSSKDYCLCNLVMHCSCDFLCTCYSISIDCRSISLTCPNDRFGGFSCSCNSYLGCACDIHSCNCDWERTTSCSSNATCTCNTKSTFTCACENVGGDLGPHQTCKCHTVCECDNDDACTCNSLTSHPGPACPCLNICTNDTCPCENICSCNSQYASCTCNDVCTCNKEMNCNAEGTCTCDGICICDSVRSCNCDGICSCNKDMQCPCDTDYESLYNCSCESYCICNSDTSCTCDNICSCNNDSHCSCVGICSTYKASTCSCNRLKTCSCDNVCSCDNICHCDLDRQYTCNCDLNYFSDRCTTDLTCPTECTSDVNCSCNNYVAVN